VTKATGVRRPPGLAAMGIGIEKRGRSEDKDDRGGVARAGMPLTGSRRYSQKGGGSKRGGDERKKKTLKVGNIHEGERGGPKPLPIPGRGYSIREQGRAKGKKSRPERVLH